MSRITCGIPLVAGFGILVLAGLGTGLFEAPSSPRAPRLDRYGDPLPEGAVARLGTTRFRHFWGPSCAALSPDGRVLVAGDEEVLRFWDTASGKEIRHFNAGVGQLRTMVVSPDGAYLAVGGGGGKAWLGLWELRSGKRLDYFKGQRGWTTALAFSPDGKTLASGGYGNAIYLWDVGSGKLVNRLYPPGSHAEAKVNGRPVAGSIANTVEEVRYSPDGRTLVCRSRASEKRVRQLIQSWDLSAGSARGRPRAYGEDVSLRIAPDGRRVFIQGKDRVGVLDVMSGEESPFPAGFPLAFSADGKRMVARSKGGRLHLLDAETGKPIQRILPDASRAYPLCFSRNGETLALSEGHSIRLWDTATGKEQCPFGPVPDALSALAFLPDGKTVISADPQGAVHLWEAATGREVRRFRGNSPGHLSMSLSHDGKTLAVTSRRWDDGKEEVSLRLWDLPRGEARSLPCRFAGPLSPDGKVLACREEQGAVVLVDSARGKEVRRLEGAGRPRVFSPDGTVLACFGLEGTIGLWDVATGTVRRELGQSQKGRHFWDSAAFISFSPDGRTVAVVWSGHFKPGDLEIWDVPSGGKVASVEKFIGGSVGATCFSADGRRLFFRSDDYPQVAIQAYDFFSGRALGQLTEFKKEDKAFRGYAQDLSVAPDGGLLASLLPGGTALVWDVSRFTKPEPLSLSDGELVGLWSGLASADVRTAYQAVGKLARGSGRTVPFLEEKLRPVAAADPARLRQLVADLGSDRFAVRDRAFAELEKVGELAEPSLRRGLDGSPSLEVEQRIRKLLEKLREAHPRRLQPLRGVQVLELIGTASARKLLGRLAGGIPEASLTREAQAALRRLAQRQAVGKRAPGPG
jgi:WD40 repeat protein